MCNRLIELGRAGEEILAAWIAKEELRSMLALARTDPSRSQIAHRLHRFYTWCADTGIEELHRLAATIEVWWPQIEAFLHTRITNAASEGINRLIKLEARSAFGFRNPANQRLRSRCATTRRARRLAVPG
jgi:transposase